MKRTGQIYLILFLLLFAVRGTAEACIPLYTEKLLQAEVTDSEKLWKEKLFLQKEAAEKETGFLRKAEKKRQETIGRQAEKTENHLKKERKGLSSVKDLTLYREIEGQTPKKQRDWLFRERKPGKKEGKAWGCKLRAPPGILRQETDRKQEKTFSC